MKSKLNDNGVYTNNTLVEIEKDASHKIIIRTANCEDGYRCTIGWEWGIWGAHKCIKQDNEVYPTEKDAVIAEINKTMKGIIDRVGVRQHATLLYFMRIIAEEYNQLDLFEYENN